MVRLTLRFEEIRAHPSGSSADAHVVTLFGLSLVPIILAGNQGVTKACTNKGPNNNNNNNQHHKNNPLIVAARLQNRDVELCGDRALAAGAAALVLRNVTRVA